MHKVATYCRVSTSKDDQINSFERQMQMYEEEIYIHRQKLRKFIVSRLVLQEMLQEAPYKGKC